MLAVISKIIAEHLRHFTRGVIGRPRYFARNSSSAAFVIRY